MLIKYMTDGMCSRHGGN